MRPINGPKYRHFPPLTRRAAGYIGAVKPRSLSRHALAATLLTWVAPTLAQVPADDLARALELARATAVARAPAQARVQVLAQATDPRLQLAPCARAEPHLARGAPVWGRTRVGLRCTQGPVAWNIFVPITVQVMAPALAVAAPLPAGARLTEADLTLVEIDWAAAPALPTTRVADLAGRTLARALPAGHALRPADLHARLLFSAGDTVRIHASGTGFAVTGTGVALSNGLEGQPARVRTEQGRVLTGLPGGDRQIEVAL